MPYCCSVWIAVVSATLLLASSARADPPDHSGPIPDPNLRFEAAIVPVLGAVWIDDAHHSDGHPAYGGQLEAEVRYDRIALVGELRGIHFETSCWGTGCDVGSSRGDELRVGLDARLSVHRTRMFDRPRGSPGPGRFLRGELWLGAGVGRETIAIGVSAARSQPDVGFSVGMTGTDRVTHWQIGLRAHLEIAPGLGTSLLAGVAIGFGS